MNDLCLELELPHSFVNGTFKGDKYKIRESVFDPQDISQDYLTWLSSLGLKLVPSPTTVLYSEVGKTYVIHKDTVKRSDFPRLNFIFGGGDSLMNWYNIKPGVVPTIKQFYSTFEPDQVEHLWSQNLRGTHLVQAGIPHNITNITEPRWCVSTTMMDVDDRLLTYSRLAHILRDYIK